MEIIYIKLPRMITLKYKQVRTLKIAEKPG